VVFVEVTRQREPQPSSQLLDPARNELIRKGSRAVPRIASGKRASRHQLGFQPKLTKVESRDNQKAKRPPIVGAKLLLWR
jgi:hypothetical protein